MLANTVRKVAASVPARTRARARADRPAGLVYRGESMHVSDRLKPALFVLLGAVACGDDETRTNDSGMTSVGPTSLPTSLDTEPTTAGSMSAGTDGTTSAGSMSGTQGTTSEGTSVGTLTSGTTGTGETASTGMGTTMMVDTTGGPGTTDNTTGPPPCAPNVCSDDLQQVLCDGNVVEQCGNGTYCIDGACTPLSP